MAKVSIVVPVYNAGAYIEQCLKSLVEQTLKDIEIILINDGSTDDSLELCLAYARTDLRIRVVDQENAGACVARNKGIQLAKGEYVLSSLTQMISLNLIWYTALMRKRRRPTPTLLFSMRTCSIWQPANMRPATGFLTRTSCLQKSRLVEMTCRPRCFSLLPEVRAIS